MAVIVACTVLHNIALTRGDVFPLENFDEDDDISDGQSSELSETLSGSAFRQAIISRYFSD